MNRRNFLKALGAGAAVVGVGMSGGAMALNLPIGMLNSAVTRHERAAQSLLRCRAIMRYKNRYTQGDFDRLIHKEADVLFGILGNEFRNDSVEDAVFAVSVARQALMVAALPMNHTKLTNFSSFFDTWESVVFDDEKANSPVDLAIKKLFNNDHKLTILADVLRGYLPEYPGIRLIT